MNYFECNLQLNLDEVEICKNKLKDITTSLTNIIENTHSIIFRINFQKYQIKFNTFLGYDFDQERFLRFIDRSIDTLSYFNKNDFIRTNSIRFYSYKYYSITKRKIEILDKIKKNCELSQNIDITNSDIELFHQIVKSNSCFYGQINYLTFIKFNRELTILSPISDRIINYEHIHKIDIIPIIKYLKLKNNKRKNENGLERIYSIIRANQINSL